MTIPPNRITVFPLKDDLQWYDPDIIFQPFDDIFGRGVVGSTDLQVVANGGGDGQISVLAGRGYVPYSSGGKRLFKTGVSIRSDAAEFLNPIPTWPGSGNPKVHRVIARIKDATLTPADVIKGGVFDVLAGTATSGANLSNLSGAQAVPADSLLVGNVLQNGSTIPTGNIDSTFGTVRAKARIGGGNLGAHDFKINNAAITDRRFLNLIAGAGIDISSFDDPFTDSADVTITNTLPAPTVPMVLLFNYTVAGSSKATIDTYLDNANTLLSQGYSTLLIRGRVQSSAAANDTVLHVKLKNDSTANYDNNFWYLDTSSLTWNNINTSIADTKFDIMRVNAANFNNGWGMFRMELFNYTAAARMGVIVDGNDTGISGGVRRWSGSGSYHGGAIDRFEFSLGSGSFVVGSRIQIYGVL